MLRKNVFYNVLFRSIITLVVIPQNQERLIIEFLNLET